MPIKPCISQCTRGITSFSKRSSRIIAASMPTHGVTFDGMVGMQGILCSGICFRTFLTIHTLFFTLFFLVICAFISQRMFFCIIITHQSFIMSTDWVWDDNEGMMIMYSWLFSCFTAPCWFKLLQMNPFYNFLF